MGGALVQAGIDQVNIRTRIRCGKAGMIVIAFTNGNTEINFGIADFKIDRFDDFDIDRLN
jgi:hypothetical protein